jgi:serine O-acetyltransferase
MAVARSAGEGASSAGELLVPVSSRERVGYALPRGLRRQAEGFAFGMLGLLFAHFATLNQVADGVASEISALRCLLGQALSGPVAPSGGGAAAVERVFSRLVLIREGVLLDARAIYEGDPAARSLDEVIVAYPGFLAIAVHRIAHELYPGCR